MNEYGREWLDLWMDDVMTAGSPQCGKANISPIMSIMNRGHGTHIHNALTGYQAKTHKELSWNYPGIPSLSWNPKNQQCQEDTAESLGLIFFFFFHQLVLRRQRNKSIDP